MSNSFKSSVFELSYVMCFWTKNSVFFFINGLHSVQWGTQLLHSNNHTTCSVQWQKYILCCL